MLELSLADAISVTEFKQRNDAFNEQIKELQERLKLMESEEEKRQSTELEMKKIRAVLEQELSFKHGVNSALVTTILDKIIVKKESTKEQVELEIRLKLGASYEAFIDREKSSFCCKPL